jgi:putative transposase
MPGDIKALFASCVDCDRIRVWVAALECPPTLRRLERQSRSNSIEIRKTYHYRLYRCDKKDRKLRHKIFVASTIWNHFIALQQRYYRLTGKYLSLHAMNGHVLKLRRTARYALWRDLHSQACQDVCKRVDDAYQRCFKKLAKGRPKFRKAKKYRSFTFPQSGYKVDGHTVTIDGTNYKFVQHRPMNGQIKTLTVKRDTVGRLWLIFSVVETISRGEASTGKSGGFDFGLKNFLTNDEGKRYASPQFYAQAIRQTRRLQRAFACKVEGSKNHQQARRALAKHSITIANRRRDHHFRLAHQLCDEYDVLYFEDLDLGGMKALWGRKVSDLGFARFLSILEWVAFKRGKTVVKIDRFAPTTKVCSGCGQRHDLSLRDRTLHCDCGLTIDRDQNAAINIKTTGASVVYQSGSQPRDRLRSRVDGRSSRL